MLMIPYINDWLNTVLNLMVQSCSKYIIYIQCCGQFKRTGYAGTQEKLDLRNETEIEQL